MREYIIFAAGALFGTTASLISVYVGVQSYLSYKCNKAQARQEHLARAQELLEEDIPTDRVELDN